jgi:hypothetical protein
MMERTTLLERARSGLTSLRGGRNSSAKGREVVKRARTLPLRLETLEERTLLDSSNPLSLTQIAVAYQSSTIQSNPSGSVQIVTTVFDARSFVNQQDLYYIQQEVDFTAANKPDDGLPWTASVLNQPPNWPNSLTPLTLQPGPQSNPSATTITSSVSKTIGGSIGWNESQGFNASFGASVTIANSTSSTVPPITINYQGTPATGQVAWIYSQPGKQLTVGTTTTLFDQWIWAIPFAQERNIPNISLTTNAGQSYFNNGNQQSVDAQYSTTIPLPFGTTFTLERPTVSAVSKKTVQPGDLFTIVGTGLYPSLIQGVFIGGQPVSMANVVAISDTAIEILAPNRPSNRPQSVVVRTTRGFSNNNVKISIQISSSALQARHQLRHQSSSFDTEKSTPSKHRHLS